MRADKQRPPANRRASKSKAGGPDTLKGSATPLAATGPDAPILAAVLASLDRRGCRCEPSVRLWRDNAYVEVQHADGCPVLAGGRS